MFYFYNDKSGDSIEPPYTVSRPTAAVNASWASSTVENIDDVVEQPMAGDGTTVLIGVSDDNETQSYTMSDPGVDSARMRLWIYGRQANAANELSASISINSVETDTLSIVLNTSISVNLWSHVDFVGSWAEADFDGGFQLNLKSGNMSAAGFIDVAYIQVFHSLS